MFKKKSLGQHFLQSKQYLELMASSASLVPGERVLEVGPGDGALTRELLALGATVTVVEKDHRLIPILKEKFAKEIIEGRLFVHEGDALEFDLAAQGHLLHAEGALVHGYKVVANIPYYITGALIRKFLSEKPPASLVVLLVQKEVAERIAREKKESILSLSVKVYGSPQYIKTVPRGAFVPPPTVDSAILRITSVSKSNFASVEAENRFFELIKTGFGKKRKLLRRNLEEILGENTLKSFTEAGIAENARAEDVPLEKWLLLARRA